MHIVSVLRADALFLFTLVLCGGCSVVPERNVENVGVRVPAHWTGDNKLSQPIFEHWVESFGDFKLSALVYSALTSNYDLKAAAARVDAAREQARLKGAGRWPQLAFTPGYQRAQIHDAGFGSAQFGAFEAPFTLSWELDVWGRISALQQAAIKEADATAADFYAARLSLAARTAQSYFELAEAKLQVKVAEQSIKDRSTIVDLVRGRFTRGLTRGLDLRLALTDLANAKAQLAAAHNRVQTITRLLEVLLGRYPAALLKETASLPELPAPVPAGIPSSLLARRPDLIAAFERLRAADFRVESTKKALLPRIVLTAAGGTRSQALTELLNPSSVIWNVAMGLTQPLFTGGRLKGRIRLNQARVKEALNLYKSTVLNAFREVEQSLAAEQWLREREQRLKEAVEQTEASRKLAVYSYRQGLIEILTLLDSYRSTLNAQSAYLTVKRQLLSNRIGLYLALGGGV